mgnify:CR=1 FL=1
MLWSLSPFACYDNCPAYCGEWRLAEVVKGHCLGFFLDSEMTDRLQWSVFDYTFTIGPECNDAQWFAVFFIFFYYDINCLSWALHAKNEILFLQTFSVVRLFYFPHLSNFKLYFFSLFIVQNVWNVYLRERERERVRERERERELAEMQF